MTERKKPQHSHTTAPFNSSPNYMPEDTHRKDYWQNASPVEIACNEDVYQLGLTWTMHFLTIPDAIDDKDNEGARLVKETADHLAELIHRAMDYHNSEEDSLSQFIKARPYRRELLARFLRIFTNLHGLWGMKRRYFIAAVIHVWDVLERRHIDGCKRELEFLIKECGCEKCV